MPAITQNPMDLSGEQTLLGILQRLRDLQAQPMVPNNPMAQLGTVLQGFASGTQGRANPALEMYGGMHQQALRGLGEEAQIGGALTTLQTTKAQHALRTQDKILDVYQGILKDSKRPDQRLYAAQGLQVLMKQRGMDFPDQLVVSLGSGSLDEKTMKAVGLGIEMGLPDTAIATQSGADLPTVQAFRASLGSPQGETVRKHLGLPTAQEDRLKAGEELGLALGNAKKSLELQDLGNLAKMMGKDTLPFALKLYPAKDPRQLTTQEWGEVGKSWVMQDMEKARAAANLQPVSNVKDVIAVETMAAAVTEARDKLADPKFFAIVSPFIGPTFTGARMREGLQRGAPEFLVGKVPNELTDLGRFESTYQNLQILARSGSAVSESEFKRNMEEAPNRKTDKPEVYLRKMEHAVRVAAVVQKRTAQLAAVGGRAALADDVMKIWNANPLPEIGPREPMIPIPHGWVPVK